MHVDLRLALFAAGLLAMLHGAPAARAGTPQNGGSVRTVMADPVIAPLQMPQIARFREVLALDRETLEGMCGDPVPEASCLLPGGLDHAAAGVGLRNTGAGTIALRGVPGDAVPVVAWLYWAFLERKVAAATAAVRFEGEQVQGTLVGIAEDPFWIPGGHFQAYRAEVTNLLQRGINGNYSLSEVPSAVRDGSDPWAPGPIPTGALAEGATLVVIYSHPNVPDTSRVYVHEGAARLFEGVLVQHRLSLPLLGTYQVRHTRFGGDGQLGRPEASPLLFNTWLGDWDRGMRTLRGRRSSVDRHSDWSGTDGGPVGQLWDTHTTVITRADEFFKEGDASYEVFYDVEPPEKCSEPASSIVASGPSPRPLTSASEGCLAFVDCVIVVGHVMTVY